jgi:hypothetical protein
VNRALVRKVWTRAGGRCEYCLISQSTFPLPFQIDHILAEKHGGEAVDENLALSCPHCNRFKGPNIAGLDPDTAKLTRLFNPRTEVWADHFYWDGAVLKGKTAVGRSTIYVLAMNADHLLSLRKELLAEGDKS